MITECDRRFLCSPWRRLYRTPHETQGHYRLSVQRTRSTMLLTLACVKNPQVLDGKRSHDLSDQSAYQTPANKVNVGRLSVRLQTVITTEQLFRFTDELGMERGKYNHVDPIFETSGTLSWYELDTLNIYSQ